jgi:hypothetical protein
MPIGRRVRFQLYQPKVSLYRLAKNSISRSFTSIGRSCWIQCPVPGSRTFFLKPGIVSSRPSKACRFIVTTLLLIGLLGMPEAFLTALLLSIAQSVLFFARKRALGAFPVHLRLAYTLLLIICFFLPIRWLFWLPAVGTFALVIFGYCLMARMLSLLPWNRTEPITADLVRRTFLSRPKPLDRADSVSSAKCEVGLCSIEAQVV